MLIKIDPFNKTWFLKSCDPDAWQEISPFSDFSIRNIQLVGRNTEGLVYSNNSTSPNTIGCVKFSIDNKNDLENVDLWIASAISIGVASEQVQVFYSEDFVRVYFNLFWDDCVYVTETEVKAVSQKQDFQIIKEFKSGKSIKQLAIDFKTDSGSIEKIIREGF